MQSYVVKGAGVWKELLLYPARESCRGGGGENIRSVGDDGVTTPLPTGGSECATAAPRCKSQKSSVEVSSRCRVLSTARATCRDFSRPSRLVTARAVVNPAYVLLKLKIFSLFFSSIAGCFLSFIYSCFCTCNELFLKIFSLPIF